jgi:hypothetical protein
MKTLQRQEILTLAQKAKLMLVDGDVCYLNDMATERELISLVRLVEAALTQTPHARAGHTASLADVEACPL